VSELVVARDAEELATAAVNRIVKLATSAIAERGRFLMALSGGSTPRPTYRLLAEEPYSRMIDWSRVELFWGDERSVPPDDAESNYRMARRALIDRVGIPDAQVHRIPGELQPRDAAAAYRRELDDVLGRAGRFDVILLGLGPDGHTASLFPCTSALAAKERKVVAVYVEKLNAWRVTLTLPVINAARHVIFLVTGLNKAEALARVRAGEQLPAGRVHPANGTLTWFVDQAAATLLPSGSRPNRGS
jgi:6-phosphogluconolactonase